MRAILLAFAVLLAAGCGAEEDEPAGGGTTGSVAQQPTGSAPQVDKPLLPPAIELVSEAGRQRAAPGSYCVDDPQAGVGECVDYEAPAGPEQLSVVRPGETVTIALVGSSAVDGTASVRRLGCEEELVSVPLEPETRWEVDLEPGAYELQIFTTFEAGSAGGDTSGVLGLVVDAAAPLEVRPAGAPVTCATG
ncbi:MAG TPA: hypothetical protein VNO56_01885 [Gaiellaceae bacterium]|nr:hypothetical protein [Gaiellaceae bacterium]